MVKRELKYSRRQLSLRSSPYLWSWALDSDWKNDIVNTSGLNEFTKWVGWPDSALEIGYRVQTSKRSVEYSCCSFKSKGVSWGGSDQNASWAPFVGGLLITSNCRRPWCTCLPWELLGLPWTTCYCDPTVDK